MASITVEIVSKTTSEAGTTFVLAASEEEIKRAGFVPYFIDLRFEGITQPTTIGDLAAVTPYGSVVMAPQVIEFAVAVLPFVPALTNGEIDQAWVMAHCWTAYELVKTSDKPNGTCELNLLTPDKNVGDTIVFYDSKPVDPA
jgi:hypothetical protein